MHLLQFNSVWLLAFSVYVHKRHFSVPNDSLLTCTGHTHPKVTHIKYNYSTCVILFVKTIYLPCRSSNSPPASVQINIYNLSYPHTGYYNHLVTKPNQTSCDPQSRSRAGGRGSRDCG